MPTFAGNGNNANFQNIPQGMGSGTGMAQGALNLANRMGDRPKGMASGGQPPKGVSQEALQEISRLMQPGPDENPFSALSSFQPEQTPMPRPAPYSIRKEQGLKDPSKGLERTLPLLVRALSVALSRSGGQDLSGGMRDQIRQDMDLQNQGSVFPGDISDLSSLPVMPYPWEGHRTQPSSPHSIRSGRTQAEPPKESPKASPQMAQQKRGGVAKKALRLAKRKRKGSSKKR